MSIYPSLGGVNLISFDLETRDPDLVKSGPSCYRSDEGYILGVGIAFDTGFTEYYALNHPDTTEEERAENLHIVKTLLGADIPKIGANLTYDYNWCLSRGINVTGQLIDVQIAEALLNENLFSYSLDNLAKKYEVGQKLVEKPTIWAEEQGLKGPPANHFYLMPKEILIDYAKADITLPLVIWEKQKPLLEKENLLELLYFEGLLIKYMAVFSKNGVLIDERKRAENEAEIFAKNESLKSRYAFNIKSSAQLAKFLASKGVPIPKTEKGNPSVSSSVLNELLNSDISAANKEIIKEISFSKKCETELNNFLSGSLKELQDKENRLHGVFHVTKGAGHGTKSGRLAMTKPNLQQIPGAKDEYFYEKTRQLFVPEPGQLWAKLDYSQVEYRVLAHYATGPGSEELRKSYIDNPDIDYHKFIQDLTGLSRSHAKVLNFGILYGMGIMSISQMLAISYFEAEELYNTYHKKAPYVRTTTKAIIDNGNAKKYLKTYLGRRVHVTADVPPHSLPNRLIQGTAADIMKLAISNAFGEGLFSVLTAHLTVHDELDVSVPQTPEGFAALAKLRHVMENAAIIKVPLKVDVEIGQNWHDLEAFRG